MTSVRYFAPVIIDLQGRRHTMATALQQWPGGEVTILPFTGETHSTLYIGHSIRLYLDTEGRLYAKAADAETSHG
ncbi:MAG: hypothetical protein HDS08_05690 [Bacteroides sp.]|nr:hypothetical protein [Bacteroides sp.]MDE6248861.1 hypothetical protein [Paramuribaculum sp.]MDE7449494.1 hypothetical protein [Paramuribaculum sp.]